MGWFWAGLASMALGVIEFFHSVQTQVVTDCNLVSGNCNYEKVTHYPPIGSLVPYILIGLALVVVGVRSMVRKANHPSQARTAGPASGSIAPTSKGEDRMLPEGAGEDASMDPVAEGNRIVSRPDPERQDPLIVFRSPEQAALFTHRGDLYGPCVNRGHAPERAIFAVVHWDRVFRACWHCAEVQRSSIQRATQRFRLPPRPLVYRAGMTRDDVLSLTTS